MHRAEQAAGREGYGDRAQNHDDEEELAFLRFYEIAVLSAADLSFGEVRSGANLSRVRSSVVERLDAQPQEAGGEDHMDASDGR